MVGQPSLHPRPWTLQQHNPKTQKPRDYNTIMGNCRTSAGAKWKGSDLGLLFCFGVIKAFGRFFRV